MSSRAKTPSPPHNPLAVPANTPMAPPATPGASTSPDTVPRTPNSGATTGPPRTPGQTPGTTVSPDPRTPCGRQIGLCSSDAADFIEVNAHTVKCSDCNLRADNKNNLTKSMYPVLKCPGCNTSFCKECREKREKTGKSLLHGLSATPGALIPRIGGVSKRRTLPASPATRISPNSPAPALPFTKENCVRRDMISATPTPGPEPAVKGKGKGKANAAPAIAPAKATVKKRAAKPKFKKPIDEDISSEDDDDFVPESPTSHKRRRPNAHPTITDEPTATADRPHRAPHAPASASQPTYVAPSTPDGSITSTERPSSTSGSRPSMLNTMERQKQWNVDVAPRSRIQELLEQAGVNTPENRYDEHLLSTYQPIMFNPTIKIPESVRRMADPTPCMSAEEKVEKRNREAIVSQTRLEPEAHAETNNDIITMTSYLTLATLIATRQRTKSFPTEHSPSQPVPSRYQ